MKPARIIPTRVGTSTAGLYGQIDIGDHPHACGDKTSMLSSSSSSAGSSPRVWGQVVFAAFGRLFFRIIPTRVGTRTHSAVARRYNRDHPHACGDKAFDIMSDGKPTGSSPRVWGQDRLFVDDFIRVGIIPTRVGTSSILANYSIQCKDHPHACGDKTISKIL